MSGAVDDQAGWRDRILAQVGPVGDAGARGPRIRQVTVDGRPLMVKTGPPVADEAQGLRALGSVPGAPPVPEVVVAEPDLLVTAWVATASRSPGHEEALGRHLATLHAAPAPTWGGGSSWIGECRVDPSSAPDPAAFYGGRLTGLAAQCGLDAEVARVVDRLPGWLPSRGPALVHGDLWWGNVLWGADGRPWLIDPSAHGGLPEEDLAMLGLFGSIPDRTLHAYREVLAPDDGWAERVELLTLIPLLVHTILFGGGYRHQVETVLRRCS